MPSSRIATDLIRYALIGAVLSLFAIAGLAPLLDGHSKREAQRTSGERLRRSFGPFLSVAVTYGAIRVGYAALGGMPQVVDSDKMLSSQIAGAHPDLLVLARHRPPPGWKQLADSGEYRLLPLADATPTEKGTIADCLVLVRQSSTPQAAARP
jgi:hypothetical protein